MCMKQWINHLLLALCCLTSVPAMAVEDTRLAKLKAEMLRLISTPDREQFMEVTEVLKEESQKEGVERVYYEAWGNQATYEATHQNYTKAEEIANEIEEYAVDQNSFWGRYIALHTQANIYLQKQDYQQAEEGFLKAVEFRHKYFPKESAGDDLQELMKIANHRKDQKAGLKYARQILAEPNVAPIHKGRALFRLSQFAFNKNNVALYDSIYQVLMELKRTDGIAAIEPVVEVNYTTTRPYASAKTSHPTNRRSAWQSSTTAWVRTRKPTSRWPNTRRSMTRSCSYPTATSWQAAMCR